MKNTMFLFLTWSYTILMAQDSGTFKEGELIKFRIHYGLVNAGYATLEIKETVKNNKNVYHVIGKGYTTGVTKVFFKVEDNYESFFDKTTGRPYQSIRKINEGGYTKDQEAFFNQNDNTILLKDYQKKIEKTITAPKGVQDVVSCFYFLRNYPGIDKLKEGDAIEFNMFFDDEIFKFKLKYLGTEEIKTKFGKISTMVFRPSVLAGRVFKENESLTVWISNDKNKIPLRIKANLAVGSLKADLEEYKGLKYPFIQKQN